MRAKSRLCSTCDKEGLKNPFRISNLFLIWIQEAHEKHSVFLPFLQSCMFLYFRKGFMPVFMVHSHCPVGYRIGTNILPRSIHTFYFSVISTFFPRTINVVTILNMSIGKLSLHYDTIYRFHMQMCAATVFFHFISLNLFSLSFSFNVPHK